MLKYLRLSIKITFLSIQGLIMKKILLSFLFLLITIALNDVTYANIKGNSKINYNSNKNDVTYCQDQLRK